MMPTLLAAAVTGNPTVSTVAWSPKVAAVMIISNILVIAFAKQTVKIQDAGPMPPAPALFGGFSIPMILAATSLGHVVGVGAILGLSSVGVL